MLFYNKINMMNDMLRFITDNFWLFFTIGFSSGLIFHFMSLFYPYAIYMLMFVLFLSCLTFDYKEMSKNLANWKFGLFLSLLRLIIIPILFYLILSPFLDYEYSLAILILSAMPTAMGAPVYSAILKGDKYLSLFLTILTSMLAPLTVPLLILFLTGVKTNVSYFELFSSLSIIIFVPLISAFLIKKAINKLIKKTEKYFSPLSVLFLSVIIGGAIAHFDIRSLIFSDNLGKLFLPILSLFGLSISWHLIGFFIAYKKTRNLRITSSLAIAVINSILAIVFTAKFFEPKTVLLVTLFLVPINLSLIVFGYFVKKFN